MAKRKSKKKASSKKKTPKSAPVKITDTRTYIVGKKGQFDQAAFTYADERVARFNNPSTLPGLLGTAAATAIAIQADADDDTLVEDATELLQQITAYQHYSGMDLVIGEPVGGGDQIGKGYTPHGKRELNAEAGAYFAMRAGMAFQRLLLRRAEKYSTQVLGNVQAMIDASTKYTDEGYAAALKLYEEVMAKDGWKKAERVVKETTGISGRSVREYRKKSAQ